MIDKPSFHAAYIRLLSSKINYIRLQAVRILVISKPMESRHAHLRPLPFSNLTHIEILRTSNLCLAEIAYLSHQIHQTETKLRWLECTEIETWCDLRRFSADLIHMHKNLEHVEFNFKEDGHSGFAPIHNMSFDDGEIPLVKVYKLTSIRDEELSDQRNMLTIMENIEDSRDEAYHQEELEKIDQKIQILLQTWENVGSELNYKYKFISNLSHLETLEFGFCFAWAPIVWRETFGSVIRHSPGLKTLSLHGWDQLGKLFKNGSRCSAIHPVRADAEAAIAECFAMMPQLERLKLVDFSIGPGLLGNHLPKSILHLEIEYTRTFPSHFTEPADVWLLAGPIKDFVASIFSAPCDKRRTLVIRLDPSLSSEIKCNTFFKDDPFLESIQKELRGSDVDIQLY